MRADLRIAITGAASAEGHALRDALAIHDVPGDHLALLEQPSTEAIISEYAGAPALIGALEEDALSDRDLVFLCGSAEESARCLAWNLKKSAIVVDLSGAAEAGGQSPVVNVAVNGRDLAGDLAARPRVIAAPQAMALAVTTAIQPVAARCDIERLAGVVVRPVSDFGEEGVEELHRQTVSLLSFTDLPTEVFGRQMAFNLLPQAAIETDGAGPPLHVRIGREVDRIMGWSAPRATLRFLVAPVFHGHAALLHLVLGEPVALADLRKTLGETPGITVPRGMRAPVTPVESVEKGNGLLVDAAQDGTGDRGFWLTVVGIGLRELAAQNAVSIAARILPD